MQPTGPRPATVLLLALLSAAAGAQMLVNTSSSRAEDCLDYATNPPDPVLGSVQVSDRLLPADIALAGDRAYVSGFAPVTVPNGTLAIIDVADETNPQMVGLRQESLFLGSVVADGGFAYVLATDATGGRLLQVHDVDPPSTPMKIAEVPSGGRDLALAGDLLYVAGSGFLEVLDVSDPAAPAVIGNLSTPEIGVVHVAVSEGYAYLGGFLSQLPSAAALLIADISDPTAPAVAGGIAPENCRTPSSMAVHGTLVAMSANNNQEQRELLLVDVSDPTAPALAGRAFTAASNLAFAESHTLYGFGRALHIFDVSDPGQLRVIGSSGAPVGAVGRLAVGAHVHVFHMNDSGLSWISILPVQCPLATSVPPPGSPPLALGSARPNPFRGHTAIHYELAEPARLDLAVYDVRGRMVRRLAAGLPVAAGEHHVIWDGLDERGGPVGRGVYFVRIGGTGTGGAAPDPAVSLRLTLLE